jgi:DNA-binding NarL/FixJ family response regulator
MAHNSRIRLVLADDHKILRDGLKSLIGKYPDMEIVAEAADGRTAVELALGLRPDVVTMDLDMPLLDGVEASRRIIHEKTGVKILILAGDLAPQIIDLAIEVGVMGFMLKQSVLENIASGIRTVHENKRYFCPRASEIAAMNCGELSESDGKAPVLALSHREYRIIELVSQGKSTKQIALEMNLSPKTIDARRRETMNKLGISNIAALTKFAIRHGIITLEPYSTGLSGQNPDAMAQAVSAGARDLDPQK